MREAEDARKRVENEVLGCSKAISEVWVHEAG